MKKHVIILSAFLLISIQLFAQNTYLVNKCKLVKSEKCTVYKYNGSSSAKIMMAGDEYGYGGFSFWDEGAYATFDLGGEYDVLTFNLGHDDRCTQLIGVVTVTADGNKILDEKVRGYEPPRAYTLNVSGVNELTFKILAEDIEAVVTDAVLWKSGQNVKPVTREVAKPTGPKELVKDIKPYYVSSFMTAVTPDEHYIMLNRQTYEYGLRGNMNMALIGTNKGNAYFNLRRQYSKLSFIVGCHDDLSGGNGSGWVTVKADGKIIDEIEIKKGDIAKKAQYIPIAAQRIDKIEKLMKHT